MTVDRTARLREAAARRHDDAVRRAAEAVERLDAAGQPINFAAVAQAASVSRGWLYREPRLRAEIERLRGASASTRGRLVPSRQRASADSQQRRIEALVAHNTELRRENERLNLQIARMLGERRAGVTHALG